MKPKLNISPTDLRDFVKHLGWKQITEATKNREFLFTHPKTPRQIYFPMDEDVVDYDDSLYLAIEKLAVLYSLTSLDILRKVEETKDDTFAFRVFGSSEDESFVPLSFIKSMINGAETLLLSSAHTILKPQLFHPRMNRIEAKNLIEKTKFRHTEPGSFIMKISCPVHALDELGIMLFPFAEDAPFVRKVTALVYKSLRNIIEAIENDTVDSYVSKEKTRKEPTISYNLCNALENFSEQNRSLELIPQWSVLEPIESFYNSSIKITHNYFSCFQEVAKELKPVENDLEDSFIGTVEQLDGKLDETGKRSGDVILHLLVPDGEPIRARVRLNAEQYKTADQAHMNGEDPYIKLTGKLMHGNQPQRITEISYFKQI